MVQIPAKPMTLEEFLKLPETKPASEYIDGQIIQKPMPQGKHSVIQGELVSTINQVLKSQYQMCPYLFGTEFPAIRMVKLAMFSSRLLIG